MTVPVVRKRAKRPKTHTGCITCRSRHIKCDEAKPSCLRCTKSGRVCEGYTAPKSTRRQNHAYVLPKPNDSMSPLPLVRSPASITCDLTVAERYAFDFFRRETAHQLPGNAWTLSWPRLVLHIGAHEPAITHIAIALGSLHRAQCLPVEAMEMIDDDQRNFALQQYGKAITHLRHYIERLNAKYSDSQVEVVLLVSLLFFCFEVWDHNDVHAAFHLRTGFRILYERYGPHREGRCAVPLEVRPRNDISLLLQTFVRLDGDLSIIAKGMVWLRPVVHEPLPDAFYSLEEAMVHLDALSNSVLDVWETLVEIAAQQLRLETDLDPETNTFHCLADSLSRTCKIDSRPDIAARLEANRCNINRCMSALAFARVRPEDEAAHLLIQIQLAVLQYSAETGRIADETHTDGYECKFEHITGLAERYVDLQRAPNPISSSVLTVRSITPSAQPFSLGTGLVANVCHVAFKSRTSSVRRRCVKLLQKLNLRGIFDSQWLVAFVQTVIDLEEDQARLLAGVPEHQDLTYHDVPIQFRVLDVDIGGRSDIIESNFYKEDTGYLIYTLLGQDGLPVVNSKVFRVERD